MDMVNEAIVAGFLPIRSPIVPQVIVPEKCQLLD